MNSKILIPIAIITYMLSSKTKAEQLHNLHTPYEENNTYAILINDSTESTIRIIRREKFRNFKSKNNNVLFYVSVLDGNNQNAPLPLSKWALRQKRGHKIIVSSSILANGKTEIDIKNKSLFSKLKIMNLTYGAEVEIALGNFSNEIVELEVILFRRNYIL